MIGVLGGTFDPVHLGHLAAARQLRERAELAEVWLMPNCQPPHRSEQPQASAGHRLEMVKLAVTGLPAIRASDLEVRRGGLSYTIDTLGQLAREFPHQSFAWLLGSDAALGIREWHEADAVLQAAELVVFNRPSLDVDPDQLYALGFPPDQTRIVRVATPALAAHEIRERIASGLPVDDLVPRTVADYIHEHRLYGAKRRVG